MLQRLFALISIAILGTGIGLLWRWWALEHQAAALGLEGPGEERLYWAIGLLAFSFLGRFLILGVVGKRDRATDAGQATTLRVNGADGASLNVRLGGRSDGPVLVLTHGWGMSSRIWGQTERALGRDFGVATWDLPGSGRSGRPAAGWSIESFADDLAAVLAAIPKGRPIILVGHSIGGMTTQTVAARHPELMRQRVAGLVLENTTYRNPLTTMILSGVLTALEPVIRLFMRLDILLSPLLWLMNWQSYLSGSTHLAMRIAGYGGRPSWGALDLSSLLPTRTSPAVQAYGNLAMFDWSVADRLPIISTPTLVFVGDRDLVTKDHAGEHIQANLRDARLIRVAKAGHMGPFEAADTYHQGIAEFVHSVGQAAPRYDRPTAALNHNRVVQS